MLNGNSLKTDFTKQIIVAIVTISAAVIAKVTDPTLSVGSPTYRQCRV